MWEERWVIRVKCVGGGEVGYKGEVCGRRRGGL